MVAKITEKAHFFLFAACVPIGWHHPSQCVVTTQAHILARPVPAAGTRCANYGHKVCTLSVQPVPVTGTRQDNAPNNLVLGYKTA